MFFEKNLSCSLFEFSVGSLWTSYAATLELHKTDLLNYSQFQLYKYRQWKILSANQLLLITIER